MAIPKHIPMAMPDSALSKMLSPKVRPSEETKKFFPVFFEKLKLKACTIRNSYHIVFLFLQKQTGALY